MDDSTEDKSLHLSKTMARALDHATNNSDNNPNASDEKYKILFIGSPLPKWIYRIDTLLIVDVNQAAINHYGYTRKEFLNLSIKDLYPPDQVPDGVANRTDIPENDNLLPTANYTHLKKDRTTIQVQLSAARIFFMDMDCMIVVSQDVTETNYYQQLDKLENKTLEMIAEGQEKLAAILEMYLYGIEQLHPGMLCSIQEKRGDQLFNLAAPNIPKDFLNSIEGGKIKNNAGSCGTAAFLKEKIISADIQKDPRWKDYKEVAERNGLAACWSNPIIDSKGNVLATFANYYTTLRSPSSMEQNTTQRAVHLLKVILENKQRELAVQISNERFQLVADATSDVIWDWNLDTNSVYYSPNLKRLFGHNHDSNIDNLPFFFENVHPDDRARVILDQNKVKFGTVNHWTDTYRFKKADGTYAFILDKGKVIRDENGLGIRMVGAMQDITKQKQEENRLKLLESVITNTSDAVVITEAEPFDLPGQRIIYVNDAFCKMTGYSAEEVIGKTPRILQGPKTDKGELWKLKESMMQWQPAEITVVNYKKNGDEFWINISISPVADDTGWYTHWISIERDVTQQKLAELELQNLNANLQKQTKELLITNSELEQFAYVASHDLQEPLRMISTYLELLADKYGNLLDEKGSRYINFAVDGASRMKNLIMDLLEYATIGRRDEKIQTITVTDLLKEVCQLCGHQIQETKAIIHFNNLPDITGRKAMLLHVFQNLVSNGLKYRREDVRPEISINAEDHKDKWIFSVEDNGIGIDEKYFDKIFIIFQRLHSKSEYSGTGLGLAITKKIIDSMGGEIWLESTINKGSTFYFSIPKAIDNNHLI